MLFHKNDQSATEADWSDKFIKKPLAVCQKILKNKIWAPVNKVQKSSVPQSGIPIRVT